MLQYTVAYGQNGCSCDALRVEHQFDNVTKPPGNNDEILFHAAHA